MVGRLENDLASRDKQVAASPLPSQVAAAGQLTPLPAAANGSAVTPDVFKRASMAATPGMARVANLYESASNFINGQPGARLPGLLSCGVAVACGCVAITRVQRRQL